MKEKKYFLLGFIAVLVLLVIFVSTQIPIAHQSIKNLPIALVVEDDGQMGQTLVKTILENSKAMQSGYQPMVDWVILANQEEMKQKMADQHLYGAIVIPADFTERYMSLQTATPTSPELQLFINQGKNANVATVVTQTLTGMITQMNQVMSNQLLINIEQNNISLSIEQARIFTAPIHSTTTILHETGSLGNAPLSLFQPLWMASIISAVLLWSAGKDRTFTTLTEQLKFRLVQGLFAIALGITAGFSLTWLTSVMLHYEFTSFGTVALFLSLTSTSFILLILAVVSWIGMAGIPIFVLLMFFGLPLLQLAPEMLPIFYKDWIYPWLPIRFMFDGIRDILFYNGTVWSSAVVSLLWIAVVSLIALLAKSLVPKK